MKPFMQAQQIVPVRPEVHVVDGIGKTTSLNVARVFNKQHAHVLRDIRNLECSAEFRRSNFGESSYINEQGKVQPMVEMTRDGFIFLVMGFTGKEAARFKEEYIQAFNRMESVIRGDHLNPFDKVAQLHQQLIERDQRIHALLERQDTLLNKVVHVQDKLIQQLDKPRRAAPTRTLAQLEAEILRLHRQDYSNSRIKRVLNCSGSLVSEVVRRERQGSAA